MVINKNLLQAFNSQESNVTIVKYEFAYFFQKQIAEKSLDTNYLLMKLHLMQSFM